MFDKLNCDEGWVVFLGNPTVQQEPLKGVIITGISVNREEENNEIFDELFRLFANAFGQTMFQLKIFGKPVQIVTMRRGAEGQTMQ